MLKELFKSKKVVYGLSGAILGLAAIFMTLGYEEKDTFAAGKEGLQEEILKESLTEVSSLGEILSSPHYQTFAEISLKVAEKNYEEALADSLALEKECAGQEEEGFLYLMNLYRIGVLQGKAAGEEEGRATWAQLQNIIQGTDAPEYLQKASAAFVSSLTSEGISLKEFLSEKLSQKEDAPAL